MVFGMTPVAVIPTLTKIVIGGRAPPAGIDAVGSVVHVTLGPSVTHCHPVPDAERGVKAGLSTSVTLNVPVRGCEIVFAT